MIYGQETSPSFESLTLTLFPSVTSLSTVVLVSMVTLGAPMITAKQIKKLF